MQPTALADNPVLRRLVSSDETLLTNASEVCSRHRRVRLPAGLSKKAALLKIVAPELKINAHASLDLIPDMLAELGQFSRCCWTRVTGTIVVKSH